MHILLEWGFFNEVIGNWYNLWVVIMQVEVIPSPNQLAALHFSNNFNNLTPITSPFCPAVSYDNSFLLARLERLVLSHARSFQCFQHSIESFSRVSTECRKNGKYNLLY